MEISPRRREQEVWQACDELWAMHGNSKSLTGDAIRERLVEGGKSRGSPNEIYKYRKSWCQSRGVHGDSSVQHELGDPISHAVRLVHEKLQADTQEQLEFLKNEHEKALSALKQDLSSVVEELSKAHSDLVRTQKERDQVIQERDAELALRMALEQELNQRKREAIERARSHEQLVQSMSKNHEELVSQIKSILNERINQIEQEKKAMGFEYSEELNKIKISMYNQKILIENQAAELVKLKDSLSIADREGQAYQLKQRLLLEECIGLRAENLAHKDWISRQEQKIKQEAREHKKRDLHLARMRLAFARQSQ